MRENQDVNKTEDPSIKATKNLYTENNISEEH